MDQKIDNPRINFIILAIFLISGLTGCSNLAETGNLDSEGTPTPLPASSTDDGLSVKPPDACLVAQDAIIQTEKPQGNLLAWQPNDNELAFVAPVGRSWGWSVGDIVLAPIELGDPASTSDVQVSGDLTWSPDGAWLAFVALRAVDGLYTVEVWRPEDNTLIDLFTQGAATDAFASQKGIVKWLDGNRLQISEGCGVDCVRIIEISVLGGEQRIISEIRQSEDDSLEIDLFQPRGWTIFPEWLNANISPNELSVFFSDENDTGWIGIIEEGIKYPLNLNSGTPLESKWSDDSRFLAVRTEQELLVFQLDCRESPVVRKLSQPD